MKKTLSVLCAACALVMATSCDKDNPREDPTGGVEAVDLGLSVKWASWNVGAKCEADYGSYFAWGETSGKDYYDWSTYKWAEYISSWSMTKYNKSDRLTILEASDDPATVNWGSKWHTPTKSDIEQLRSESLCEWKWETKKDALGNDVNGYTVTSKVPGFEGKSIFLPAAGYRNLEIISSVGDRGDYWSSEVDDVPYSLNFNSSFPSISRHFRSHGLSVRAVQDIVE